MERKRKSRNCARPGFWLSRYWYEFPTYRDLLKELPDFFKRNDADEITIIRQKRGEWGEWFEKWQLQGNKPVIIKQGWM